MKKRRLLSSFKAAFEGMAYTLKTQRNMKIHFAAAGGVIFFAIVLGIEADEILWIFLAIVLVLVSEILNTFFEDLLDFVNPQYSKAVKHMKDVAAAGVLTSAVFSVIVALIIFGNRFGSDTSVAAGILLLSYLVLVLIISVFSGGEDDNKKSKSGGR